MMQMSNIDMPVNPRGLFDRSALGRSTEPVEVEVERGRVQFFAKVLGETDSVHSDLSIARAQGHPDLVAPPSFFMVIQALADEALKRRGLLGANELVRCDFRRLLHGDETYTYSGFVYAGERLTLSTTVLDFFDKKGGALEFVTLSSAVTHAERGVVLRTRRTLLHRLD